MLVLLCGCGAKRPDPVLQRLDKLEQTITELQERNRALIMDFINQDAVRMERSTEAVTNNTTALKELVALENKLYELSLNQATNTNRSAVPRPVARQAVPQKVRMFDGIPEPIYVQIALDAEKKWPGDFEMQDYVTRQQVAAYKRVHSQ